MVICSHGPMGDGPSRWGSPNSLPPGPKREKSKGNQEGHESKEGGGGVGVGAGWGDGGSEWGTRHFASSLTRRTNASSSLLLLGLALPRARDAEAAPSRAARRTFVQRGLQGGR